MFESRRVHHLPEGLTQTSQTFPSVFPRGGAHAAHPGKCRTERFPALGASDGRLVEVAEEIETGEDATKVTLTERTGLLHANLTIGANVTATVPLEANSGIAHRGFQLIGSGFIVTREEASPLGLGRVPGLERHIREYRNGRDLTDRPRGVLAIDLFGLSEN